MTGSRRPRVLYLIRNYPRLSETYIQTELTAVGRDHDVMIVCNYTAGVESRNALPYVVELDPDAVCELVEDFRPDVLHVHWLDQVPFAAPIARRTGVPYTVRTHGFDVLWGGRRNQLFLLRGPTGKVAPKGYRRKADFLRDDLCLGVIGFPFARRRLRKLGVPDRKIRDCFPVVDVERFLDRSANGDAVMYSGPAIATKDIENFLTVAAMTPDRPFNLYTIHDKGDLARRNDELGRPATIYDDTDHEDMPAAYKKHGWMLRLPGIRNKDVGWSVSIAEAQASGVGVCMTRLRPDLEDYVGKAGFLVESPAEARDVISKPFPDEMRELGFEQAKKSDVRNHLSVLTDLWEPAFASAAR